MKLATRSKVPLLKCLVVLGTVLLLWMALVDRTWSVFICDDCGAYKDTLAYRVAGVTLYSTIKERKSPVQRLAEDLGKPCRHLRSTGYVKHRLWGLVWCGCPCLNGIDHISGEDWYDAEMSSAVRTRWATDSDLADQFYERVIVGRDQQFLEQFRSSLSRQEE
jgi:hypothetical protein